MYTIFFTINCVEQLTFSKTFVDQLQFKQLIFFCLKVKLLEIHVQQMIFHDFWFSSNWQEKMLLLNWCRAVIKSCQADFSSNRISSRWSWPFGVPFKSFSWLKNKLFELNTIEHKIRKKPKMKTLKLEYFFISLFLVMQSVSHSLNHVFVFVLIFQGFGAAKSLLT
jgi:hypothetical protein